MHAQSLHSLPIGAQQQYYNRDCMDSVHGFSAARSMTNNLVRDNYQVCMHVHAASNMRSSGFLHLAPSSTPIRHVHCSEFGSGNVLFLWG